MIGKIKTQKEVNKEVKTKVRTKEAIRVYKLAENMKLQTSINNLWKKFGITHTEENEGDIEVM